MDAHSGLSNLYTLADGDPEFIKEILELMRKNIPEDIADMERSLATNNMDAVRRSAHHMKSSIQYSDDAELPDVLSVIESKKDAAATEIQTMLPRLKHLSQNLLQLIEAEILKIK